MIDALLGAAAAVFVTGNDLHEMCREVDRECKAYIIGVHDALAPPRPYCTPIEVRGSQIQDVVRLYLEAHPEERHRTAPSLIVTALSNGFPCPKRP